MTQQLAVCPHCSSPATRQIRRLRALERAAAWPSDARQCPLCADKLVVPAHLAVEYTLMTDNVTAFEADDTASKASRKVASQEARPVR